MLELYFCIFGIFQVLAGLCELIFPFQSYVIWKKWIFTRYFFTHGIILIAAGFPFIIFKGFLSGIIFWIGIFMVLTGPFLLIYPEKVRNTFISAEKDFTKKDLKIMIYIDAIIRFSAGIIVFIAFIKTSAL